jgi:peptide chain release factor
MALTGGGDPPALLRGRIPFNYTTGVILETLWLSISAGKGPEECAYAAALTMKLIIEEAEDRAARGEAAAVRVLETEPSRIKGNIRSALLAVDGKDGPSFAASWTGVIQWIWQSRYRPHHKRKNWFVLVRPCALPAKGSEFSPGEVRFETARSSGPGGQKVNKTETAVRAVHVPTGKSAVSRTERSQWLNKQLSLIRLASLLEKERKAAEGKSRSELRHIHYELERGNPVRIYDGETLKCLKMETLPKPAGVGKYRGNNND